MCIIAFLALKLYARNYYRADEAFIAGLAERTEGVHSFSDNERTLFIPDDGDYKAVILFYPGGKVEYTAYSSLMYKLAERGIVCVLSKMPENLALLDIDAAGATKALYPEDAALAEDLDWYMAGHSLGGVAACKYLDAMLKDENNPFSGVILCASYPTEDFSDDDIRLLSLYGSNDGVLNVKSYEESRVLWPLDTTEYVIPGGIHSYFGSYGLQKGDGEPQISNEEQLDEAAEVIEKWIEE
ncbi:MAG: alpha/beta hydrolase [Butyrivibrio sp.]|nr:alpha/beta hydrolase [Butyrivibrio sp.]